MTTEDHQNNFAKTQRLGLLHLSKRAPRSFAILDFLRTDDETGNA
jgi:hypothetical protein